MKVNYNLIRKKLTPLKYELYTNQILNNDGVIAFVTDTVWGIGCLPTSEKAVQRIYEIKNRPKDKPLACLCANINQIKSIAYTTELADKLIIKFLPGALTIILKTKDEVKAKIGYETITDYARNVSNNTQKHIKNGVKNMFGKKKRKK